MSFFGNHDPHEDVGEKSWQATGQQEEEEEYSPENDANAREFSQSATHAAYDAILPL